MELTVLWIIVGGTIGFAIGGVLGTVLAPQSDERLLAGATERLRQARTAAIDAADRAENKTTERFQSNRRRRRGRGRGRGRRRRRN